MKKLLAMAAAIVFALGANAQIEKGEIVVGAGVGLGNTVFSSENYNSVLIPINFDFELGVAEDLFDVDGLDLGVGALVSYTQAKAGVAYGNAEAGYRWNATIVGAKGALHYNLGVEKLDTYVSLALGYDIITGKPYGSFGDSSLDAEAQKSDDSEFYYGISLGARYWFSDALGATLEAGYGLSFLKVGINYRF